MKIRRTSTKERSLESIRFVAFDFDGVFTDNRVVVSENGLESVICNRSDGVGLAMLREIGIGTAIISTEENPVVAARARKLNIDCYGGSLNKVKTLEGIISPMNIPLSDVAFLGNDVNDLDCLKSVGFPVAVADAFEEVKRISRVVLKKKGGQGAVREFCEMIYRSQNPRDLKR